MVCVDQTPHALTLVVWKKYARTFCVWKVKYPGTPHLEGIYCGVCRPDATCLDTCRLEEICTETLHLEGKMPWHSLSEEHMPGPVSSGRHMLDTRRQKEKALL